VTRDAARAMAKFCRKAAEKNGVPFTLSTMSICSIEDVGGAHTSKPFWFRSIP